MLLLPLLLACQAPEDSWPGLVLLDGSAERAGVRFVDSGAPLRSVDSPIRWNGGPERLDAEAGELLWVTGELDLESWDIGTDVDPDAIDLITDTGLRPALADALGIPATLDPTTGAWRLEATEILLTVALSDLDDIVAVLPVGMEEEDDEGTIISATGGTGRRAALLPPTDPTATGLADRAGDGEGGDPTQPDPANADDPFALTLGNPAAAAFVGLHESNGGSLLLAADGTWTCRTGTPNERGTWALNGDTLDLATEAGTVGLPAAGFTVLLTDSPCTTRSAR